MIPTTQPGANVRTIGRYELLHELGRGTMGVVYRAHDPELGRDVALKTIQTPPGSTAEERALFEERFLREARIVARLAHPGIVMVHDIGRDAATGLLFLAFELVPGQSLDRVCRERGALEWREALGIAGRVAQALHHAHGLGIVHRDVKPANVLLLPSGEPKLTDFGIAKLETSHLTATGQLFGTPLYMSPEQALAHPIDARSDQFSLGAVLYELLTGRRAFAGENVTKIVLLVIGRDPEPLRATLAELPEALEYVVGRTLTKDPARRYPDCKALAEDIEDVLAEREPRHRAGWVPMREGSGTLVSPAVAAASADGAPGGIDLDLAMAALVSTEEPRPAAPPRAPAPEPAASRGTPARPPAASQTRATTPIPARPRRSAMVPLLFAVSAAGLVAAVGLVFFLMRGAAKPAQPAAASAPAEARPSGAREPAASPSGSGGGLWPFAKEPAKLVLDFEHSLRSGKLLVFVDGEQVVDQTLDSGVRKIVGLKFRKGRFSDDLELSPGRHDIVVEVRWNDGSQRKSTWANFKSGVTYRLEAKLGSLGGLRKNLSLNWE